MRALAAILILTVCTTCLHANRSRALKTPLTNVLICGFTLGPSKCLNALTTWRAERALRHPNLKLNLKSDLAQFPWKQYRNTSEEELYTEVCDGTEKLLRRHSLSLTMLPGYRFELLSKGNGTLNVDVYKNAADATGRSSIKKAKKKILQFIPLLVIPGLIMSAILPFVLPSLKMMTLAAVMLNNMALSGAVFTLLRNNAFNDKYEHRVIYVNEGYKNEKHTHHGHGPDDHYDVQYEAAPSEDEEHTIHTYPVEDIHNYEELPLNANWMNQYYGDNGPVQFVGNGHKIKRRSQLN